MDTVADVEVAVQESLGLQGGVRALADACLVVDSLGRRMRRVMLEEFVQLQLVQYENLFGMGKQHHSLGALMSNPFFTDCDAAHSFASFPSFFTVKISINPRN